MPIDQEPQYTLVVGDANPKLQAMIDQALASSTELSKILVMSPDADYPREANIAWCTGFDAKEFIQQRERYPGYEFYEIVDHDSQTGEITLQLADYWKLIQTATNAHDSVLGGQVWPHSSSGVANYED